MFYVITIAYTAAAAGLLLLGDKGISSYDSFLIGVISGTLIGLFVIALTRFRHQ